jgi:GntR family transcriptional regulator, transcriptional repressor for pyruvate dehydrogenase complex
MKIQKALLPDMVCDIIKAKIKSNEWKVYKKIPSEGELAETMGVNRLTIRMALQKLNTLGIVEKRVGEGTFVKNFSFSKYITKVSDFYMSPELLDYVYEFRKLLEIECAHLAIERATPQELAQLKEICDQYELIREKVKQCKTLDQDLFKELIDKDLDFHQKIVSMSGNLLFSYSFIVAKESIYQYMLNVVNNRMNILMNKYNTRVLDYDNASYHRPIYQAIVDKDFMTCKKLYLDMLDPNKEF